MKTLIIASNAIKLKIYSRCDDGRVDIFEAGVLYTALLGGGGGRVLVVAVVRPTAMLE